MKFTELKLHPSLQESISAMGFVETTPIQAETLPAILNKKDLIACAQTGTGKTAAYIIPVLNKLITNPTSDVDTLIIVPTRELALQIDQQFEGLSYFLDVSSVAIYGGGDGDSWTTQKNALVQGTNIVIATPGRLISHMNFGYVNFDKLTHLILDEADRMLDMGFFEDIVKITSSIPEKRQTLMFSATMPEKIRKLAHKVLENPVEVNLALSKPAEAILQVAYLVYDQNKIALIKKLLDGKDLKSILIFSATKRNVKSIRAELVRIGLNAKEIHSDLEQSEREQVILEFRNRKTQILVATDILARGIDIEEIDLVLNFDVPGDAEDYVHRVGRTARAKASGVAITFINDTEQGKFKKIEELIELNLIKLPTPEEIGESPKYEVKKLNSNKGQYKKRYYKPKRKQ
ncbi:MAG: ATP-dependent RNA helicase [Bacteroidetes bacterium 4572_117]|nr:MAG: ATP-dependent RNA helicase [Bacteroidetes bacterium 4572_117]